MPGRHGSLRDRARPGAWDGGRPGPLSRGDPRLTDASGRGPVTAMATAAFAPAMATFERGRDFSARLGLVPRRRSPGGWRILGRVSRMGRKDLRRLLIIGAMSVVEASMKKRLPEQSRRGRLAADRTQIGTARRHGPGR
ncbi:MAG: transposase [Pseudomonadota bacterium]